MQVAKVELLSLLQKTKNCQKEGKCGHKKIATSKEIRIRKNEVKNVERQQWKKQQKIKENL